MTTKTVKPETPAQAPVFELRQGQKQANLDGHDETYEPPEVYVGTVAPPRQPDVMSAPAFMPKPMQALRPGAQDFMRCPSHGTRC